MYHIVGMRIIKSTLSLAICLVISWAIGYGIPLYACVAAVQIMKVTPEASLKSGMDRTFATIAGGLLAGGGLWLATKLNIANGTLGYTMLIVLISFINLLICKQAKLKEYICSFSSVVILIVMISHTDADVWPYITVRVLETIAGIVVALVVNKYMKLPTPLAKRAAKRLGSHGEPVPVEELRIVYTDNDIEPSEYNAIRKSVGWQTIPSDQLAKAIINGQYTVSARLDNKAVAAGRLVGDGCMYWYLQDVVVSPWLQGHGVGKAVVEHLLAYAKENSLPGSTIYIGLTSAEGREPFYEKLGFQKNPSSEYGAGMFMKLRVE